MHRLFVLKPAAICLLVGLLTAAMPAKAVVLTTTQFGPPTGFGYVLDGRLFEGSPFISKKVVEVRIFWDIEVSEGYDAANVTASVILPIGYQSPLTPWPITPVIDLGGAALNWSGTGVFNHTDTLTGDNLYFGQEGTGFTHQAGYSGGSPFEPEFGVDILPTSRIEIDYIVPLPGDTDGDDDVDDSDIGTAFSNYTGPVGEAGGKTLAQGDMDGDGDVDDSDIGTMFSGYTGPISPVSVPEPATALVLSLGLLTRLRRQHHAPLRP